MPTRSELRITSVTRVAYENPTLATAPLRIPVETASGPQVLVFEGGVFELLDTVRDYVSARGLR